jgi:hypothetical protein
VAANVVQVPVAQACVPSTNPAFGDTKVTEAGRNPASVDAVAAAGELEVAVGAG